MASRAVRKWFREYIVSAAPTVPYLDTVNKTPDPKNLPDLWCTLEFQTPAEDRLTLGGEAIFREFGVVNVIAIGLSGRGDDPIIDAAELLRTAFTKINVQLPVGATVGYLRIDTPEPPNTDATESGNWFLASVSCAYTFDVVH